MTLTNYIATKYLESLLWAFLSVFFLILLVDGSEQMTYMASKGIGALTGLKSAIIRSPIFLLETLPLIVMLGSIICFLKLTRHSELIVARAAGRSAVRILVAPVLITFLLGTLGTTIGNPIVATSIKYSEQSLEQLGLRPKSLLSVSADGIWLREASSSSQTVVHANRTNLDGTMLFNLTIYQFDGEDTLQRRIYSEKALLKNGYWQLIAVKIWSINSQENGTKEELILEGLKEYKLNTELTKSQILDSFADPKAISFWRMTNFIGKLELSGFSAVRHKVFYHSEIARPFFLIAMMLIGAGFAMQQARFGQTGILILTAVLSGFVLFSIKGVAIALGEAEEIPMILAAYSPPIAGIFFTTGLLLHLEDG